MRLLYAFEYSFEVVNGTFDISREDTCSCIINSITKEASVPYLSRPCLIQHRLSGASLEEEDD